jgi:hypothetical protein
MKFKEVLREALDENQRKGNYIRIYPSRGSEIYDKFFTGTRPYNRFLFKCLYTSEIIPMKLEDYHPIDPPPAPVPHKRLLAVSSPAKSTNSLKEGHNSANDIVIKK